MLTSEQISIIRKYVPEKYFSQEKLIRYLSIHEMVGVYKLQDKNAHFLSNKYVQFL